MNKEHLEENWRAYLGDEFKKDYMTKLNSFLASQIQSKKTVYPNDPNIFAAFKHTPFDNVKIVILGQDPYHGAGQANGLSFSVQKGVPIPPSLRNIYKEIGRDLSLPTPSHGCLESWASQGVLLLNSVLTVEHGKAGSHQKHGWETFTDAAVNALNDHRRHLVFLLWGNHAAKKGAHINQSKHLALTSAHPSPLSAHRGFLGNNHFSTANTYLIKTGQTPIDWSIPEDQKSPF